MSRTPRRSKSECEKNPFDHGAGLCPQDEAPLLPFRLMGALDKPSPKNGVKMAFEDDTVATKAFQLVMCFLGLQVRGVTRKGRPHISPGFFGLIGPFTYTPRAGLLPNMGRRPRKGHDANVRRWRQRRVLQQLGGTGSLGPQPHSQPLPTPYNPSPHCHVPHSPDSPS